MNLIDDYDLPLAIYTTNFDEIQGSKRVLTLIKAQLDSIVESGAIKSVLVCGAYPINAHPSSTLVSNLIRSVNSKYFGFIESELKELCAGFDIDPELCKSVTTFYNGYFLIYNFLFYIHLSVMFIGYEAEVPVPQAAETLAANRRDTTALPLYNTYSVVNFLNDYSTNPQKCYSSASYSSIQSIKLGAYFQEHQYIETFKPIFKSRVVAQRIRMLVNREELSVTSVKTNRFNVSKILPHTIMWD